jgi:hypothetical protein
VVYLESKTDTKIRNYEEQIHKLTALQNVTENQLDQIKSTISRDKQRGMLK